MNILFVNHMGLLGGGEKSMIALMRGLRGLRDGGCHRIMLMSPEGDLCAQARNEGFTVFPYPFTGIRRTFNPFDQITGLVGFWRGVASIDRIIASYSIAIIHANSLKSAVIGGLAARRAKSKVIFHARDFLSAGLLSRPLIAWAYRLSANIIVNSQAVAGVLGSDPDHKVTVVYNAIDVPAPPSYEQRHQLRAANGILRDAPLIGYVGRLHPQKGIETLLDGFSIILGSFANAWLWIAGGTLPGEEKYLDHLKRRARNIGMADRTIFFGWRSDAIELMSCLDVLVLPSQKEPFGRVTVEAMLLGVPVVATASGGTLEIIDDGQTGLLFPPGDSRRLAEAVMRLISDRTLTERLTERAKQEAAHRFSREQYIGGVEKVYDSLAGK
ncbi:MAG: glycosyltransferase family 4 protein [Candidatus Edwardsbacteria bacterium]|nr:glycosyltransferase family 4 protein [Candidatus Edwardsbacteria bacterium]